MVEYTDLRLGLTKEDPEQLCLMTEDGKIVSYVEKLTIEQTYGFDSLPLIHVTLVCVNSNEILSKLRNDK